MKINIIMLHSPKLYAIGVLLLVRYSFSTYIQYAQKIVTFIFIRPINSEESRNQ